ncbi:transporter substrate-binding domain-containing protein [Oxalobacteraceae bacterium]|nr:transporter substrate-binding domain-containing protein [Oxalobacteraceae bacterium]
MLLLCLSCCSAGATTLQACADQAEMPPFAYAERTAGGKGDHIVGVSVDLLRQIGRKHGWDLNVVLLPWARCLAMVADHRIELAINIGLADAKASELRVSMPYFTMHNVYFYSRRARPQGLDLAQLSDVRKYHLCGLGGYRFEAFGIDTQMVDRGTTAGYEQLIQKLHLGRCDLFIDSRETMAGQYLINPKLRTLLVDGTLVSKPLPGSPTRTLYFGVASGSGNSAALLEQLNRGLAALEKTKELDKLLNRYLE